MLGLDSVVRRIHAVRGRVPARRCALMISEIDGSTRAGLPSLRRALVERDIRCAVIGGIESALR